MNSIISKLRINYKSLLYFLVISIIPIITISILVLWFFDNQTLAKIFIIFAIIFFFLILLFTILLNHKLISPIILVTENLNKLQADEDNFPTEIDPFPFQDEIKDLLNSYNSLLHHQKSNLEREKILEEKRNQFETALQGSEIGLWDWNLKTNECYFSATWRHILGHTQESIHNLSTEWFTRVHPEDIDHLRAAISDYIDQKTNTFSHQHRLRHFNDNYLWVVVRGAVIRNEKDEPIRFIGTTIDITSQKNKEHKLSVLAMYDTHTGLPNKIYFSGIIDQSLGRLRRRDNYQSAVLSFDLDRFKNINDKYGYEVGNDFLMEMTRRLKYSLRTMDTIARFTEDKFGVLLEEINGLQDVLKISKRLHSEITKPFQHENEEIEISTSIGVVMLTRGYQNSNEVLRDAETAVIQAKAAGRGIIELFDKESYEFQLSKIRIENEIKQALENEEFGIQYHPIFSAKNDSVLFAESELVWKNPERGIIPNQYYSHTAEDCDETISLNKFHLRKACQDAQEWNLEGFTDVKVAVKISSKLFLKPDFPEIIICTLADSNLPNTSLQLIVSENSLTNNAGITIQHMYELYNIGVTFCLDQYGAIPSTLDHLKRLPIQSLKISEAILRDLPNNQEDISIAKAIISIGKILGIEVIATGIDTQEKSDLLINAGVDMVSGQAYESPLDTNGFVSFLKQKTS